MTSDDLRIPLTQQDIGNDSDPMCKWCCIYAATGVVVFGGIITLVYFFYR